MKSKALACSVCIYIIEERRDRYTIFFSSSKDGHHLSFEIDLPIVNKSV